MTDAARCEPPPELRSVDGWHWIEDRYGVRRVMIWAEEGVWHPGGGVAPYSPEDTARYGWHYIAPVATPAEVEALKRERDEIKAAHEELANADYRWAKENATLRERVRGLEEALRPFAAMSARFPDAKGWASLGIHVPEMPTFADCHAARAALTPSGDGA